MNETLANFQQEWYERIQKGMDIEGGDKIPVEYEQSEAIKDDIRRLKD